MGLRILISLMMFPAAYLVGAFIAADFNSTSWAFEVRLCTASLGVWAAIVCFVCPFWWDYK